MNKINDRIKELRRVPASSLIPNDKNFRNHPKRQRKLLSGILKEVGIADAVLAREDSEGNLHLIDGHLRTETLKDQEIPVLVLDVTEEEADKILSVFDPLTAMANTDQNLYKNLLEGIESEEKEFASYINAELEKRNEYFEREEIDIPQSYQVIVDVEDEEQQKTLFEEFTERGLKVRLINVM